MTQESFVRRSSRCVPEHSGAMLRDVGDVGEPDMFTRLDE